MPLYIKIDCCADKLKPLLQSYQYIPYADMAAETDPNVHYLAFYHTYAVTAAKAFARKNSILFSEISENDLRSAYRSHPDLVVKGEQSLSPFRA